MNKRLFDIVASSLGLIILAPILACIAISIKLSSPGPVFYRGVRTGRYGRPFKMFKFRTMVVGAEKLGGTTTGKNDPRVTSIGWLLRKYKLDELPQLINVLRGEMSIVGPRPEVEEYTSIYNQEEQIILNVRPGITDYASMNFVNLSEIVGSENPDKYYAENVRPLKNSLRVKYVKEQTFWGDMKIILMTLQRLLRHHP